MPQLAEVVAPQGKICAIVSAKNNQLFDMNPLQTKSVTFCWELMFTRSLFTTTDMIAQHQLLDETARLVDQGILKTTLTEQLGSLNAATLRQAHSRIEKGDMIGKLVLDGIKA